MTLHVDMTCPRGELLIETSFQLEPGITALFGPSGAGKTSVFHAISGLIAPTQGHISLQQKVLFDSTRGINLPPHQRHIGYIFQDARLFPHLDIQQNLLYGRRLTRHPHYTQFDEVIELLGIAPLLKLKPAKLSGGEQQRVAIGRALLSSPQLLLMDEPLVALDAPRKAIILDYILDLQRRYQLTLLYISHDFHEVVRLADHLLLMRNGCIEAAGSMEAVTSDLNALPQTGQKPGVVLNAVVQSHLEADPMTRIALGHHTLLIPRLEKPVGTALRLHVLADDVALATTLPVGLSMRNRVFARIEAMQQHKGGVLIRLDAAGTPLLAHITRMAASEMGLQPGQDVHALFKSVPLAEHSFSYPPPPRPQA